MPEEEERVVTYEFFRKYHRAEQTEKTLQELPDDFYSLYREWLVKKRDTYEKTKEPILEKEIKNAERIIDEIVNIRFSKILDEAKISARSKTSVPPKNMLPDEEKCLSFINNLISEFKNEVRGGPRQSDDQNEPSLEEKEKTPQIEGPKEEFSIREGYSLLRIMDDLDSFVGTDEKVYGPFKNGDIATLPEDIGEFLIKRERAELLNPEI